jgi:hypothetical protein
LSYQVSCAALALTEHELVSLCAVCIQVGAMQAYELPAALYCSQQNWQTLTCIGVNQAQVVSLRVAPLLYTS